MKIKSDIAVLIVMFKKINALVLCLLVSTTMVTPALAVDAPGANSGVRSQTVYVGEPIIRSTRGDVTEIQQDFIEVLYISTSIKYGTYKITVYGEYQSGKPQVITGITVTPNDSQSRSIDKLSTSLDGNQGTVTITFTSSFNDGKSFDFTYKISNGKIIEN